MSEAAGAHDETLVENWLLRLCRERFRSRKSGKSHDFFVAYLNDGVHVVALTPGDEVVLVRQFRAGLHRDSLETPGGLIEDREDPCTAGARELLEETGYSGDPPELLGVDLAQPGASGAADLDDRHSQCDADCRACPRSDRGNNGRARPRLEDRHADQARRNRTRSLRGRAPLVARQSRRTLIKRVREIWPDPTRVLPSGLRESRMPARRARQTLFLRG